MHTKFRIAALTAALTAFAPVAFAEQVTLNFDEFNTSAGSDPVAVGTIQGLQFQGAYGYGVDMLDSKDNSDLKDASSSRGGFILNRQRNGTSTDIIITLEQNATARSAASVFFEEITLRLWTDGAPLPGEPNPNALIAIGADGTSHTQELTVGGAGFWVLPVTYKFDALDYITSLRFSAGTGSLALDDLVVSLSDGSTLPPPNGVPEPASFGLIGLALLGAGAASRRKQRG
jgi:hypothetical protein